MTGDAVARWAPRVIGANVGNWLPTALNPSLTRLLPRGWDAGRWDRGHEPFCYSWDYDHRCERSGAVDGPHRHRTRCPPITALCASHIVL